MSNFNNLPMPLIHLNTIKLPRIIQLEPVNARCESKSHLLHVIIDCIKQSFSLDGESTQFVGDGESCVCRLSKQRGRGQSVFFVSKILIR